MSIYAEIELINGEDLVLARHNFIGEDETKRMPVNMPVDTGSLYKCIHKSMLEQSANGQLETIAVVAAE